MRNVHRRFELVNRPRLTRSETFAADVNAVRAIFHGSRRRFKIRNFHAQFRLRAGIFYCSFLGENLSSIFIVKVRLNNAFAEKARLMFSAQTNVSFRRLIERANRRKFPHALFIKFAPVIFVKRVAGRVGDVLINFAAVSRNDSVNKFGRAHSAFDFERVDAALNQRGNVAQHAHIAQRELVAGIVENFAGRLVDKFVRPAAGFETAPAVAALPESYAGMNALPRNRKTHIAVDKIFGLDAGFFAQEFDFVQAEFAADNDAVDAEFLQQFNRRYAVNVHHHRRVDWDFDAEFFYQLEYRQILHD